MSALYDVYTHADKGEWGVAVIGQTVKAVHVRDGNIQEEVIPPYRLASEIAKRVKTGYTKAAKGRYLHVREDEAGKFQAAFVVAHPELNNPDGVVLFTQKSAGDDMQQLAQQWEAEVEKTDARPEDIARWIKAVGKAQDYIVAPASHPAFALVIGDWAISNKRILSGARGGIPVKIPKEAPLDWREWLNELFPNQENDVIAALEQLGWSYRAQVLSTAAKDPINESAGSLMASFKDFAF